MSRYYLGLDNSTQSLTAVLIDGKNYQLVSQLEINFSSDLEGYNVTQGFLANDDQSIVHAPPLMWVAALEQLFLQMQVDGWPMKHILAIAGSAQQHGSVYLNATFNRTLNQCDPAFPLHEQLHNIFSRATAPIWMDSSTRQQCAELTAAFGGATQINQATGSVAVERFTGAQIKKFADQQPGAYAQTAHIMLVSSFMTSLLAGRQTGIDFSDASGMNLLDIHSKSWHPTALSICGDGLENKLLPAIDPTQVLGKISNYFAARYGFNQNCQVLPWCGDNPSSLIGLGLVETGMTAISLGTSDTCFGLFKKLPENMSPWAHTFITPTKDYMSLLCFKNGSLAREAVRQQYHLSWNEFNAAIASTPPGNKGAMMLPWFASEIVPKVSKPCVHRFGLDSDNVAGNCRAVIEGQMMSMRNHAEQAGLIPNFIRATGGAAQNPTLLKMMADVFNCPVQKLAVSNSAALGAAMRAVQTIENKSWLELAELFTPFTASTHITPDPNAQNIYEPLRQTYKHHESTLLD